MSDHIVKQILGILDRNVAPKVKRNAEIVDNFKERFREALPKEGGRYTINIIHCGSAYEGLAVDVNADFDIAIQLAKPFESDNFKVERDPSGFFTLQWKSHLPESDKLAADCDGYVDAARLRKICFDGLQRAIDKVQVENAKIKCTERLVALEVTINYNDGYIISMDLVPQIVFRTWGQCPDLRPLQELPECLRCYIDRLNKNKSPIMFFSLAVPGAHKYSNPDQLFNVSFSLLEKEFINSNVKLRDMVRLVKLVAKQEDWKSSFYFQSFMAKRIATKHCEELMQLDHWEGYKTILSHLSEQVAKGEFDGYFIIGQITNRWDHETAIKFQDAISNARLMDPRRIKMNMVGYY